MNRYFVSNWRLLIGSCLAFVGSLLIAVDKLPPVHHQIDRLHKWTSIRQAIDDLDVFDHETGDGNKVGYVDPATPGFDDLAYIIKLNKPELKGKIVGIAQNAPMNLGGVPSKIIHIALEGQQQGLSVTTDFIFSEWVTKYREQFFLKRGLILVTLGFLMGIIGRINKRKKAPLQAQEAPY